MEHVCLSVIVSFSHYPLLHSSFAMPRNVFHVACGNLQAKTAALESYRMTSPSALWFKSTDQTNPGMLFLAVCWA